jgi:TolA-binding protein
MKRLLIVMAAAGFLFLSACSGQKAKETFETAKLEELQRNFSHARQLYREILEKYPKSEYAEKAAERLKELETK